jgi:hypothetical protein
VDPSRIRPGSVPDPSRIFWPGPTSINQLGLGRSRDRRRRTNAPPSEPFRRSSRCAGTTPPVPTDRGCSGLHAKPLDASIGRVFGPYCPGRTAGSNAIKKIRKSTILVSRFARPVGAPVRNQAHRPTEGVQGYPGSHWSTPLGEYGGRYMQSVSVFPFFF